MNYKIILYFSLIFLPSFIYSLPWFLSNKEIEANPQYKITTELRSAIKAGNLSKMHECIQHGADVNDVDGHDQPHAGTPMLAEAINQKSVAAVELLLKSGARVETEAEIPTFQNILKPITRNVSHLSYAIVMNAPIEIITLLIRYSKNLNATDFYFGWTAYKIAAFCKNYEAMKLLEEAGADTDASIPDKLIYKKS